jgi:tetratricopeptide (TPR) repeat protein
MFKHPYLFKLLFAALGMCLFAGAAMASPADTSNKKGGTTPNRQAYDFGASMSGLQDAFTALKADSMDKGLHLLVPYFRLSERTNHITRMADYSSLAIYNFIIDADEGRLNATERNFLGAILKDAINRDESDYQTVAGEMNKAPATLVNARLRLFILFLSDKAKAEKLADKILKDTPDDIAVNTLKAEMLYDNDKYKESVLYCSKLISLSALDAYAYELKGKNEELLEKYDDALADYERVMKLYPANKTVYYHRSMVFMDEDKYREAVPGLQISRQANPDYMWTSYNLAKCYDKLNQADSAFYYVNQHISLYPNDEDGYDLKGSIFYDKNDYANAIDQFDQAIRLNPEKEVLYEDRGDAHLYSQKYNEALADFLKALQLDKHRVYALDQASDCYYNLKEYRKAITYAEMAIKIDPYYKYGYLSLGLAQTDMGEPDEAITTLKKAIAIDSTYDTAIGDLGWAYYCTGDNDACIKYSYKALKYNPEATYAMFNIALATLKAGDAEKAKALYTKFIAECKAKGYTISDGAVDDLKNLMKKNIAVEDCKYIIEHLFEKQVE